MLLLESGWLRMCVSLDATCDPPMLRFGAESSDARISLYSFGIGSLFHNRLLCWQYSLSSGGLRIRFCRGNSPSRTHRSWGCGFCSSERKSAAFWFRWLGFPICWACCFGAFCTPMLDGRNSKDCRRWRCFSGEYEEALSVACILDSLLLEMCLQV